MPVKMIQETLMVGPTLPERLHDSHHSRQLLQHVLTTLVVWGNDYNDSIDGQLT